MYLKIKCGVGYHLRHVDPPAEACCVSACLKPERPVLQILSYISTNHAIRKISCYIDSIYRLFSLSFNYEYLFPLSQNVCE